MKKVLLIWEEIPESTKLYLIPENLADVHRKTLRGAAGTLINANSNDDTEALWKLVKPPMENHNQPAGDFHQFWVDDYMAEGVEVSAVYVSGFVL